MIFFLNFILNKIILYEVCDAFLEMDHALIHDNVLQIKYDVA